MMIEEPADCFGASTTLFVLFILFLIGVNEFIIPWVELAHIIGGLVR